MKNEEFYLSFSPAIHENLVESKIKEESEKERSSSKEKMNNLLLKMIKSDKKPGSLL